MKTAVLILTAFLAPLWAQEARVSVNVDQLAAKARNTVDVTLEGPMLKLAGRFLTRDDKLLDSLKSISVKSFQFSDRGAYTVADLEPIRAQVRTAGWFKLAGVKAHEDGGTIEIYCKDAGNGKFGGVSLIAAEPKELTVVSVIGNLDPAQLAELSGQLGIPRFELDLKFGKR